MNSRVTMGLAAVLLLGAIVVGYWGLVLSRQPAPVAEAPVPAVVTVEKTVAAAEDQTRQPVVVLVHDVPPFTPLTAADLAVEKLRSAPAGSLGTIEQVVGRTPWRHLSAGTWLNDESFEAGGTLARMIHRDERALAVSVDEVIGAAGQLVPGDYVDVLLFLRQDASNPQQSAQIVVPAMRVLGVGEQYGLTNDGQPSSPALSTDDKIKQDLRRIAARTVVLAVPEQLLSRMMLATQVGTLRLAVRSSEEQRLAKYWAGESQAPDKLVAANSQLFQFTQLALGTAPKAPPSGDHAGAIRPAVEVIRGNQINQQNP
ncbi:Flp pilus assembly protein CpaB [Pseudomonas sp. FW215-R2]|jgi:pilus assembly protein CpaB|uniref:Flp pilus assembly protein CpaB n=1 Tax=unclassified Pseudomonas TaxID=196821 RepID=UPI000C88B0B4|nr:MULTISPECIES: Flp pilus assembly protein CpaB [unclassified Pseudomonas]PMX02909.1 Flp pilus assembly protein CpaB [Pseudomonas sp. FW215-R2]PMX11383.1 Flp pilus assembly protein CpaB [Pseudomonas sp. FW215-L1]PMX23836.1 Flp pilus assembly protein CpaB [Pseudomonas sp. FW215-E1]PNA32270.1 Flp pilus assembly protein CpaB [Pseudomonas sp. FW215-R4]